LISTGRLSFSNALHEKIIQAIRTSIFPHVAGDWRHFFHIKFCRDSTVFQRHEEPSAPSGIALAPSWGEREQNTKEEVMRLKKAFWGALVVSGSLGVGAAAAHDGAMREPSHVSSDRRPSSDDTTLAPSVPGVTEESLSGVSERNAIVVEEALAGKGYDPGAVDGMIDSDTRAAIREFQSDHDLAVTGSIDRATEDMLARSDRNGMERSRPSS
jgi:hypothetical protein